MDSLLTPILSYVLLYKYVAIFFVVYTGAVIIPWPANAMLLAVGAFASQGFIGFWTSLAVAVVANCLGDLTDYGIARRFGERFIHRLKIDKVRFFIRLKEEFITDAGVTVFITRFAGSAQLDRQFLGWIRRGTVHDLLMVRPIGKYNRAVRSARPRICRGKLLE